MTMGDCWCLLCVFFFSLNLFVSFHALCSIWQSSARLIHSRHYISLNIHENNLLGACSDFLMLSVAIQRSGSTLFLLNFRLSERAFIPIYSFDSPCYSLSLVKRPAWFFFPFLFFCFSDFTFCLFVVLNERDIKSMYHGTASSNKCFESNLIKCRKNQSSKFLKE